jgi:hypothetical protein
MEIEVFNVLFHALSLRNIPNPKKNHFVKILDAILHLDIFSLEEIRKALFLLEKAMFGKLIGLWPSPKFVNTWVAQQWAPKIYSRVFSFASCYEYFIFIFLNKEVWN